MATSKELLTNLADELRTLTNTTDKMGLSVMAGHVSDANDDIDASDALVEQIMSAMSGKSVPPAYETCTVTISNYRGGSFHIEYYTLQDGVPVMKSECSQNAYSNYAIDVIVGSHMVAGVCSLAPGTNPNTITGGIVRADSSTDYTQPAGTGGMCFLVTGDGSITFTTV